MHEIHPVDIAVLVGYFIAIAGAGVFFATRNRSTEAYFLGNRNFPAWALGLSLVGTSISSVSFLAYPADAYKTAYLRLIPAFVLPVAIFIAARWVLPFFRRGQVTTAFEYLEMRFSPGTRVYGAVAFIFAQVLRISLILYLVALLVHEFTRWDIYTCIVVSGVFVSFYTVLGGIEAVVWTDVVQTIVLVFGGLFCLFIIVGKLPGGLGQIFDQASEASKFALAEWDVEARAPGETSWGFSLTSKTALMMLFVGFVNWMYEYTANQNVVQRYCASRSAKDARRSMWICCWTSIPIWTYFMFLGTALWVFYQEFPVERTEQMLSGEVKEAQILPFFIMNELPIGLAGLVVAAVLAAAMSSLDSSMNAIATVATVDILKRHLAPNRDDAFYLRAARGIAIVCGVVMIIGATIIYNTDDKTAQDTVNKLVAISAGGLLGLYALGMLTRHGSARAVAVAIALTIAFTTYRSMEGLGWVPALPIDPYYTGIVGHLLLFGVGYGLGMILPGAKKDLTNLTVWTQSGPPPE